MRQINNVSLEGRQITVIVEGGSLGAGLVDTQIATDAAARAEAAAAEAEAAAATVGTKADRDGANVIPVAADFRENIGAASAQFLRSAPNTVTAAVAGLLNDLPATPLQWGSDTEQTSLTGAFSITSGQAVLFSASGGFPEDIIGKLISVPKAISASPSNRTLLGKVVGRFDASSIILSVNATATLSSSTITVTWANDDSDVLQAMLDGTLPGLAPCRLSRVYHVSKPITIRRWRTLQGTVSVGQILNRTSFTSKNGMIVMWPGAELTPLNGAKIENLTVGGADAMINPPIGGLGIAEANDAVSRIAAWSGTAFKATSIDQTGPGTRDGAMDVEINNCSIIGMGQAIKLDNIARWNLSNLKIDCLNGIELSNTFDTGRVLNLHIWGFWNGNYGHGVANPMADVRPGKGLWLHSGIDGCLFTTALIFGMRRGIVIQGEQVVPGARPGVYACQFVNYWVDNVSDVAAATNTVGIETIGECRLTKFVSTHVDAQDVNWKFGHNNDQVGVTVSACSTGLANTNQVQINTGSGIINGFQLGGGSTGAAVQFGVNHRDWIIDNVLSEDESSPLLFNQADPVMRRKVTIGKVKTRNSPGFIRNIWMSLAGATKTTNQTIAPATQTNIDLEVKTVDAYGEIDLTTNAYYAARPGMKRVSVSVDYAAASATASAIEVRLFDQTAQIGAPIATITTDIFRRVYTMSWDVYQVATGDVLYATILSTVGGTLYSGQTYFQVNDYQGIA